MYVDELGHEYTNGIHTVDKCSQCAKATKASDQLEEFDLRKAMIDAIINAIATQYNEPPDKMLAEVNANSEDNETFVTMIDAAVRVTEQYANSVRKATKTELFKILYAGARSADLLRKFETDAFETPHDDAETQPVNPNQGDRNDRMGRPIHTCGDRPPTLPCRACEQHKVNRDA